MFRVRFLVVIAGVLAPIGVPGRAEAGPGDGSIRVVATGAPVAVTSVAVHPEGASTPEWTTSLAGPGTAVIQHLPPGNYDVIATPAGGSAVTLVVSLHADDLASIELRYGASGPPAMRLVDRGHTSHETTFDRTDLAALPSGSDLSALLDAAAPFVVGDRVDNGGLATGTWTRTGNRGASWTDTTAIIGDLKTTNTMQSPAWSFLPDLTTTEAVSVRYGGFDATFDTAGTAVVVTPRRPGASWWRMFDVGGTSPGMVSSGPASTAPAVARIDDFVHYGFQTGGPVTDRTGLFLAATQNRLRGFVRRDTRLTSTLATSAFVSTIARRGDRDEIRVQGGVQQLDHPFDGASAFRTRDVSEHDTFAHGVLAWDRVRADGSETEYAVSFEHTMVTPIIGDATGGTVDRILDGPMPMPATEDSRRRVNARAEFDLRPVGGAIGHAIRAGGSLDFAAVSSHVVAAPTVAELVDGVPARVWVPTLPDADSSRHAWTAAGFLTDRIALHSHVTADLGLRAFVSSGSSSGSPSISWAALMPRASLRWGGPAGAISVSYGRYQPALPLAYLAYGDRNGALASVYRWIDANHNGTPDVDERGPLVAYAGTNQAIASIDGHLTAPRTDEFALSGDIPFGDSMRLRASIVTRRQDRIVRSVNVGAPLAAYRPVLAFDDGPDDTGAGAGYVTIYERLPSTFGQDRYLLTNPADDRATYDGVEAQWELRTRRWSAIAGAMAYRTAGSGGNRGTTADENDQGVLGDRFETPNATPVDDGRLFFDRSYVLKWSTSYRPGRGVTLAFTARYQDGQPFGRLVVAPVLAQGADFVTVDHVGHTRFTFLATIDTRVEKAFTWSHGEAAIVFDVFNLTNRANEVEEDIVAGPTFRDTTAVQPPRTLRLSARIRF